MKEVKNTRKPLIFYYAIAMVVLMLLNALVFPRVLTSKVTEVDYGEFLKMAEDQNISKVQVTDTEIVFADKATPTGYYKTGFWSALREPVKRFWLKRLRAKPMYRFSPLPVRNL